MIVERSMHSGWLSNAFLLADEPGGTAVFVDSGAPLEPLIAAVEREAVTPTHLLVTHGHADHVAGNDELVERYRLQVTSGAIETGGLRVESLATPGHSDDGVSFVVGGLCFSGDTLFRDAVGGGPADEMRRSRSAVSGVARRRASSRVVAPRRASSRVSCPAARR